MSNDSKDLPHLLISVIDDDPLRARSDARELLAQVSEADPTASLRLPSAGPAVSADKGGDVVGVVGLVLSAGSLAAACVQVWLAKVPQRTIVATRPDGATLRITGRQAQEDAERLEQFLADDSSPRTGTGEEDDNAAHRKVRARVEHVIGRLKNYKILRDCRQHGDGLHHAVQAVAHMHDLALAS